MKNPSPTLLRNDSRLRDVVVNIKLLFTTLLFFSFLYFPTGLFSQEKMTQDSPSKRSWKSDWESNALAEHTEVLDPVDEFFADNDPTEDHGWCYKVNKLDLSYAWDHPDNPNPSRLMGRRVRLMLTESGWIAPSEGQEGVDVYLAEVGKHPEQRYFSTALQKIAEEVVKGLHEAGVAGVFVSPHANDIGEGGEDLRSADRSNLRLLVEVPSIAEMHVVSRSRKGAEEKEVDNERHKRILDQSPASVGGLIVNKEIDDYVARLNRHPNRTVEVAVASYKEPEAGRQLALDYVVTEDKPWLVFAHVANTGSQGTDDWRETFGFKHCQLTCADDILNLNYVTASFDDYHLFNGSYERPFCSCDCLHWKVGGTFHNFVSSDLGIFDSSLEGDGWGASGELIWTCWQFCDWFVDTIGGFRWQNYSVDTFELGVLTATADVDFLLFYGGVVLERCCPSARTRLSLFLEGGFAVDASTTELEELGRSEVNDSWAVLKWDAIYAFYLDPYLSCCKEVCGMCHNLEFAFRGQTSFGTRLPAQFQYTIGGMYSVRGYEQSVAAGDSSLLFSAEYRLHLPCFFGFTPGQGEYSYTDCDGCQSESYQCKDSCFWDAILSTYIDYGSNWHHDRGSSSVERNETLVGTGVGLELIWSRHVVVRGDWSVALHDAGPSSNRTLSGDSRGYVSVALMY